MTDLDNYLEGIITDEKSYSIDECRSFINNLIGTLLEKHKKDKQLCETNYESLYEKEKQAHDKRIGILKGLYGEDVEQNFLIAEENFYKKNLEECDINKKDKLKNLNDILREQLRLILKNPIIEYIQNNKLSRKKVNTSIGQLSKKRDELTNEKNDYNTQLLTEIQEFHKANENERQEIANFQKDPLKYDIDTLLSKKEATIQLLKNLKTVKNKLEQNLTRIDKDLSNINKNIELNNNKLKELDEEKIDKEHLRQIIVNNLNKKIFDNSLDNKVVKKIKKLISINKGIGIPKKHIKQLNLGKKTNDIIKFLEQRGITVDTSDGTNPTNPKSTKNEQKPQPQTTETQEVGNNQDLTDKNKNDLKASLKNNINNVEDWHKLFTQHDLKCGDSIINDLINDLQSNQKVLAALLNVLSKPKLQFEKKYGKNGLFSIKIGNTGRRIVVGNDQKTILFIGHHKNFDNFVKRNQ